MDSSSYATLSSPALPKEDEIQKSTRISQWVWGYFVSYGASSFYDDHPTVNINNCSTSARSAVCAALRKGVTRGRIEISDALGTEVFGCDNLTKSEESRCGVIRVKDNTFWVRVYLWYDIGCKFSSRSFYPCFSWHGPYKFPKLLWQENLSPQI